MLNLDNPINYSPIRDELELFLDIHTKFLLGYTYRKNHTRLRPQISQLVLHTFYLYAFKNCNSKLWEWLERQKIDMYDFDYNYIFDYLVFRVKDPIKYLEFSVKHHRGCKFWRSIITEYLNYGQIDWLIWIKNNNPNQFNMNITPNIDSVIKPENKGKNLCNRTNFVSIRVPLISIPLLHDVK